MTSCASRVSTSPRFGINVVALPVLVELGLHRIPAQAIILAPATLLSYFGHRHFSFRRGVDRRRSGRDVAHVKRAAVTARR